MSDHGVRRTEQSWRGRLKYVRLGGSGDVAKWIRYNPGGTVVSLFIQLYLSIIIKWSLLAGSLEPPT